MPIISCQFSVSNGIKLTQASDDVKTELKNFREDTSRRRWLIAVNQVSEGVDIKRLRVLVNMSHMKTELHFRQVVGRVERMREAEVALFFSEPHRIPEAWIYYPQNEQMDAWVKIFEEENAAGVVAIEKDPPQGGGGNGGGDYEDTTVLTDFNSANPDMVAGGTRFDAAIVAFVNQKLKPKLSEVSDKLLCELAADWQREGVINIQARSSRPGKSWDNRGDLQRENSDETRAAVIEYFRTNFDKAPEKEHFAKANSHLNKKVGIKTISEATVEELEHRLKLVRMKSVHIWLTS